MEPQHPNKDPLKLNDKIIGYAVQPFKRFAIKVFSHPSVNVVQDTKSMESIELAGETYRYSVHLNFRVAGRKVITCKVLSNDITDNDFSNDRLKKKVIDYLEKTSEEICASLIDDERIPWEDQNSCA